MENIDFKINEEKSNNVLLWIISKLNAKVDFHKLFKILYFAEQKHLAKYGRFIIGDKFIAMKDGPVPSEIYYFLKRLRQNNVNANFKIVDKYYIIAQQEVDLDELSESEILCLQEAINENKDLSYNALSIKSHKMAWKNANPEDDEMSFLEIAKEGGANAEMLKYITLTIENQTLAF